MSGWGAAFAKQVESYEVIDGCAEDDPFFVNRTKGEVVKGNAMHAVLAILASEQKVLGKRPRQEDASSSSSDKRKYEDENDDVESEKQTSLEGMLHPETNELVLIDRSRSPAIVYSGTDRGDDGEQYIRVGHLDSKSGKILLDKPQKHQQSLLEDSNVSISFPYPTFSDDHCETPIEAYEHIKPLLKKVAKEIFGHKKSKKLKLYDPYYCDGSMVKKLQKIGFPLVYNVKEDCYRAWETDLPDFDVFLTNPPYSGDHIEKLVKFVTGGKLRNRPWMLLMPEWVHKKDYFVSCMGKNRPLYVIPNKRYIYIPPPGFRDKKLSDTHKKSSPFTSYWYIWGGSEERTDMLADYFVKKLPSDCDIARTKNNIRDLRRKGKRCK